MSQDLNESLAMARLGLVVASICVITSAYVIAYPVFLEMGLTTSWIDKGVRYIVKTGGGITAFNFLLKGVAIYFSLLFVSSTKEQHKEESLGKETHLFISVGAGFVFLLSTAIVYLNLNHTLLAILYIVLLISSYSIMLFHAYRYKCLLNSVNLRKDRFNEEEEQFEQVDTIIGDEYSIHIPAWTLSPDNPKRKRIWWNIVNPFAGNSVTGNPGTGKSYVFIIEFIRQTLLKGWAICIYDYKNGELTDMTFRYLMKYREEIVNHPRFKGMPVPQFGVIDLDDPMRSMQINPLSVSNLETQEDCKDLAYVFMENLNRSWATKQGEFFPESAKNYFTACITLMRFLELEGKEGGVGNCSTFPHVIAFINSMSGREKLFTILAKHPKTRIIASAFKDAMDDGAMEQLSGQTATVKIAISSFATDKIFWTFSKDEANTHVSNPNNPFYLCLVNNEKRSQSYTPVLSLILGQVVKKVNSKGNIPVLLAIDELPTVYVKDIDKLIATARSNKVAVLLGFQDYAQLIKDYKKEVADVTINTVGNIISGRVVRETARSLQDMFGKIKQKKVSVSKSATGGTSTSESTQMDFIVPEAKIATLSQGQFVLKLSDTMDNPLPISISKGYADVKALGAHRLEHPDNERFQKLERPIVKEKIFIDPATGKVDVEKVMRENYIKIIEETEALIEQEYYRCLNGHYDNVY